MVGGRRGSRGAIAVTLAVILALASWSATGNAGAASGAKPGTRFPAVDLLLRLGDLPLGYRLLDFLPTPEFWAAPLVCDSVAPANQQPRLASFLDRYAPTGCFDVYYRLFHVPGAKPATLSVGSGAMDLGSVEGAEAGMTVAPELLSHLIGDELPEEATPPALIGDATRLFHWHHPSLFKQDEKPSASFLVWRSGNVVAATFSTGGSPGSNDRVVAELAALEQKRIETPTPATVADFDSAEVALENPALEVPVYWLGRPFAPGHGMPKLTLYDSSSTTRGGLHSPRASLLYTDHPSFDNAEAIYLNLWSPRQWKQLRAKGGALPNSLKCGTSRRIQLPHGHAVIFSGYERWRHKCRGQRAFTARISLGRVVATMETTHVCATCAEPGIGPYDTFRGMATLARGLERRLKPHPLP